LILLTKIKISRWVLKENRHPATSKKNPISTVQSATYPNPKILRLRFERFGSTQKRLTFLVNPRVIEDKAGILAKIGPRKAILDGPKSDVLEQGHSGNDLKLDFHS